MGKNPKKQLIKYLAGDILSALLSWLLFYFFILKDPAAWKFSIINSGTSDPLLIKGLIFLPPFWILINLFLGLYRDLYRRSRLKELGASVITTISGTVLIFIYLFYANSISKSGLSFINYLIAFFCIHFLISYIPRLIITSKTISAIRRGRIGFNTIIIGSDKKAVEIFREINNQIRSTGNNFIGFININGKKQYPLAGLLDHLGGLDQLPGIISKYNVEEVIIAIESTEHGKIENIINKLDYKGITIKAIPGMYDILTGRVHIDTIIETPLIQISHKLMPAWQKNLKQILDILFSLLVLILFLPLSFIIAIWIKISSKGPVIYSHERIGRNGKPFKIYKFRTMIDNAEINGPELSSANDGRITKAGRFLRKTRLDEIPNFINVLKGDMSVVGPRPERKYYINQIVKKAPHYNHLLRIKPGITSWGQVRYGYAENVDQMIQRLKYDIIYLENMSIFVDFQILILTILTIFKRKGV
ncbi:MAG: sugar transferase [Bacteroidales bacterium]